MTPTMSPGAVILRGVATAEAPHPPPHRKHQRR
jgi:hypothetical protein